MLRWGGSRYMLRSRDGSIEPLLVNKTDAATMLGVEVNGLNQLIQLGELKVVWIGKSPRLSVEAIKLLVEQRLRAIELDKPL
jgi:hypothetical protein